MTQRVPSDRMAPIGRHLRDGLLGASPQATMRVMGNHSPRLREVIKSTRHAVSPDDSVQMAAQAMAEFDLSVIPVLDKGRIVGVLSERDLTRHAVALGRVPGETPVSAVMNDDPVRLSDDRDVESALLVLQARGARELVVQDFTGRLVGMFCTCERCDCAAMEQSK